MNDDDLLGRIRTAVAAEDVEALDRLYGGGIDALSPEVRLALADAYEFIATHVQEDLVCRKIPPPGSGAYVTQLLERRIALDPTSKDASDALAGDVFLEEAYALRDADPEGARTLAGRARALLEGLAARGGADARDRIMLGQALLLEGRRPAPEAVAQFQASYREEPQSWPLGAWLAAVGQDVALRAGFDAFRDARLAERPEEALFWADAYLRAYAGPTREPWLLQAAARVVEPLRPSTSWSADRSVELGHLLETLGEHLQSAAHREQAFAFFEHARAQGDPDGFRTIYAAGALRLLGRVEEALALFRRRAGDDFDRGSVSFFGHYLEALWDLAERGAGPELRREIEEVSRHAEAAAGSSYQFPYQSLARLRLLEGNADGAIEELKKGPGRVADWIDEPGLEALRGHPRLGEFTS